MSKNGKLTAKQEAFAIEYSICHNGTKAAIKAGYSARSARQIAEENLTKPDIQEKIAEQEKEAEKTHRMERRLIELSLTNLLKQSLPVRYYIKVIELLCKIWGIFDTPANKQQQLTQRLMEKQMAMLDQMQDMMRYIQGLDTHLEKIEYLEETQDASTGNQHNPNGENNDQE